MSHIQTKTIGELVFSASTPDRHPRVEHYLIPDYQRGYRWRATEHVKDLLDDVDAFRSTQRNLSEYYCLQPIVVVKQDDCWEIIDGQQRLTTINLILRYLMPEQSLFELRYTHRPQSTEVLLHPERYKADLPDHYYICEAYKYIKSWFEEKEKDCLGYKSDFQNCFLRHVRVIWYEVDLKGGTSEEQEREKIGIFNRLNIGKIPLDDAELIRALFIRHFPKGEGQAKFVEQTMFAGEWNEMEHFLGRREVWGFIHNERKSDQVYANRILKIFEILAKQRQADGRATFKWFEGELKGRDRARELWREVKFLYECIRHWYEDIELYHWIGVLIAADKSITLHTICDISRQSADKKEFKKKLHSKIRKTFQLDNWEKLTYEDASSAKRFLLLFNVLSTIADKGQDVARFRFADYHRHQWSVEHINAQNADNPYTNPNYIKDWLDRTKKSIEEILSVKENPELKEFLDRIHELQQKNDKDVVEGFTELCHDVTKWFEPPIKTEEASRNDESLHEIANLALLTTRDNTSLSNDIFPTKRNRIAKLLKEGHFIPRCTQNVFFKTYSPTYSTPYLWDESDKKAYLEEISRIINKFIKLNEHK